MLIQWWRQTIHMRCIFVQSRIVPGYRSARTPHWQAESQLVFRGVCIISLSAWSKINNGRIVQKNNNFYSNKSDMQRKKKKKKRERVYNKKGCEDSHTSTFEAIQGEALPCHVHYRACTFGIFIHPWLGVDVWVPLIQSWSRDELSGWVQSARPLGGSAERGFLIGFLSEGGGAVVRSGPSVGVSHELRVDVTRLNLNCEFLCKANVIVSNWTDGEKKYPAC